MWFTPDTNIRSISGLHCDNDVRKCSVSHVNVSDDTSFFPVMWAADEAYFSMDMSESFFLRSESVRKPYILKFDRPKPTHSGMSTQAYAAIRFAGEP